MKIRGYAMVHEGSRLYGRLYIDHIFGIDLDITIKHLFISQSNRSCYCVIGENRVYRLRSDLPTVEPVHCL
jgi:hypothetical protein